MKKISQFAILLFVILIPMGFPNSSLAAENQIKINLEVVGILVPPVLPPTYFGGGPMPDKTIPEALNLTVIPEIYSAALSWETKNPSLSKILWGETPDYEKGSLSEIFFTKDHSRKIANLSPDTLYYFRIEIVDHFGNKNIVDKQTFRTLILPDTEPPANVRNLTAAPLENSVLLQWTNPEEKDFEAARILRSEKFYPTDPFDGELIYEGAAEKFEDKNIKKDVTYYYTVFSRDRSGNYSSGAVVSARVSLVAVPLRPPFEEFPQALEVVPEIRRLSLADFDFIQDNKKLFFVGDSVKINGAKNLKISLNYEKVPEVLKTIGITLRDSEDNQKVFSFLLRVNADKTAFDAIVAPLGKSGLYPFEITVLDYKNQGMKKLGGEIVASVKELIKEEGEKNILSVLMILALILLIILLLLAKRKRERKKEEEKMNK